MRVLLVAGSFPPEHCGVGDYTEKLAVALASTLGIELAVLTTQTNRASRRDHIDILDAAISWRLSELSSIVRAVRKWRPDLVHFQFPSQGFFHRRLPTWLPLIFKLLGIKVIETWHEPPPKQFRALLHFLIPYFGAVGLIFVRPNYIDFFSKPLQRLVNRLPQETIQNTTSLPTSRLTVEDKASLRSGHLQNESRLIVFFGFVFPHKGVERIFEIANPATDRIVIAGNISDDAYGQHLIALSRSNGWLDHVSFLGFLGPVEAADLIASADAVLLPFVDGGGDWNTSIHAALAQGTLVITTGYSDLGDHPMENMYIALPSDLNGMRRALNDFAGRKVAPLTNLSTWKAIAQKHVSHYQRCIRALND